MTDGLPAKKRPLFQREHRDPLRYRLSLAIADGLSWTFAAVPGPVRRWIATRIGATFYRLSHAYRQNVEANVCHVLGKDEVDADVCDITRTICVTNAINFMDLLTMARRSNAYFRSRTTIVQGSWDIVHEAHARGKGVIFLSAHVGCFDFIGQSFQAHGFDLTVVTGRTTSRFIFDGVTHLRRARGANLVEPTPSGVRQVMRALKNNHCAVLVADRDFFQNGVPVTFFGAPTTLPPGPARIARDTGAAIVPVFTRRTSRGHELRIYPWFTVDKTRDVEADVQAGMDSIVPVLEDGISACIEQWVMLQRAWPERPAPPIRVFPEGSPIESELLEKAAHVVERVEKKLGQRDDRPRRGEGDRDD